MALFKSNPSGTFGFSGNLTTDRRGVHFDVPPDRLALGPANVGHLLADQVLHPPEASPSEYSALMHVKPPQPDRDIRRSPRSPYRRDG